MRRALRIVAVAAGIVSVVSTVILWFIYLESMAGRLNGYKDKLIGKISERAARRYS